MKSKHVLELDALTTQSLVCHDLGKAFLEVLWNIEGNTSNACVGIVLFFPQICYSHLTVKEIPVFF